MEIKNMNNEELQMRLAEIETAMTAEDADLDALSAEVAEIEARRAELLDIEERRQQEAAKIAAGETRSETIEEHKEKKTMTNEEMRATHEYNVAYANYLKTENDAECRALLTEIVNGDVPVPSYVEGRIQTAWQRLGLLDLVRKSYVRGILSVGFELSATAATVHTEGTTAVAEETLHIGKVTLTPQSIKKWISISDEALDLSGEEFLDYIYDEVTYQIAKKAQALLIGKITALTGTASSTAVSVGVVSGTPSLGVIANAIGTLSDEASNPVVVINKSTWAQFKAAQYAGNYAVDPFEGLPVHFDSNLPAYAASLATNTAWAIVGDFGRGALANFPNGDDVRLKFDDLSLAEKDLVKIVGREYVGLGIVADKAFAKIVK